MACKPPWTSTAKARPGYPRQTASRHADVGASVPGNPLRLRLARSRQVEAPLSTPSAPRGRRQRNAVGRCRRNAAGHHGVKLDAAPDAPHWGEVLVRTPTDQLVSARRRAISTFICPSRESQICLALAKDLGDKDTCGQRPSPGWPASGGGGRLRWQTLMQKRATGCRGSRDPHPGKDPL